MTGPSDARRLLWKQQTEKRLGRVVHCPCGWMCHARRSPCSFGCVIHDPGRLRIVDPPGLDGGDHT